MNNAVGLEHFVRSQINSLMQFVEEREFLSTDKTELYALGCLSRAIANANHYFDVCINDRKIIELGECLAPIDSKIRNLAEQKLELDSIKKDLSHLLTHIEENFRLNQEAFPDKLMADVVVFEKSEFGDQYDHIDCALMYKNDVPFLNPSKRSRVAPIKFSSKKLPGYAVAPQTYDLVFKQFKGCIEMMPVGKLRLLIDDLNINLPSNSLILPHKEYVPLQVLVDLPRLSMLLINGQPMLESKVKEDKDALLCMCMHAMQEEVDVALSALKLVTQATLARPTYIIYTGFQDEDTMTRVSQALDVVVSIKSQVKGKPLKHVEIRMWAYFGLIKGEEEEPFGYIGVMRKLLCTRDFLKTGKAVKGCEAVDVYSSIFPKGRLVDLKRLDFDEFGEECKKGKVYLT